MPQKPKVSIIVPVYNAAAVLRRCIDSILKQEFTDYELLLMDDGSSDESPAILDEYAMADTRIRVVHKSNSGVSDTRNRALDMAGGDYIQFLDADDWIAPEATKLMVRAMEQKKADLVVTDFYRVVGEHVSHKGDIEEEGIMDLKTFAGHMMENPADFYYGVIWNKLYSRRILKEHHIRMDPQVNWCEDFLFNMEYLLHCGRIYALQVPVYYYVKTEGSLVSQGMSIAKTVDMKMSVFRYYNDFFARVYDPENYEARRIQIYGFLGAFARDAGAISFFPGTKRLGRERQSADINPEASDTLLTNAYYQRKVLDKYLEPVGQHYDLSNADLRLLLTIAAVNRKTSRRQLAAYAGVSSLLAAASLQKLLQQGYVDTENRLRDRISEGMKQVADLGRQLIGASDQITAQALEDEEKQGDLNLHITDKAADLAEDLVSALADYRRAIMADFTQEEERQYLELTERVGRNARAALEDGAVRNVR